MGANSRPIRQIRKPVKMWDCIDEDLGLDLSLDSNDSSTSKSGSILRRSLSCLSPNGCICVAKSTELSWNTGRHSKNGMLESDCYFDVAQEKKAERRREKSRYAAQLRRNKEAQVLFRMQQQIARLSQGYYSVFASKLPASDLLALETSSQASGSAEEQRSLVNMEKSAIIRLAAHILCLRNSLPSTYLT
ncbi:hypothetical protein Ciccas_009300 [Cichlidogyrus casuarinus]|uniref:BZIP domain-containing protein n=1 Tax=Cichlidogyrus casuarinus TaxID=1844966 RepID=A0ABD2PXF4_9PLAT